MEVRRGGAGDRARALTLLNAAGGPFESIGMPGWLRRAEEFRRQLGYRDELSRRQRGPRDRHPNGQPPSGNKHMSESGLVAVDRR